MCPLQESRLPSVLKKYESNLMSVWIKEQLASAGTLRNRIKDSEIREQSAELLRLVREAIQVGDLSNFMGKQWNGVREFLASVSRSRAVQGFAPSETASFIFSLRTP